MTTMLVPRPKRIRVRKGWFAVGPDVAIVLAPGHSPSDFLAASQLADEIDRAAGFRPPVEAHARLDGLDLEDLKDLTNDIIAEYIDGEKLEEIENQEAEDIEHLKKFKLKIVDRDEEDEDDEP